MSSFALDTIISLLFTAGWVLIDLGLAVVAFYRFRTTPAGLLMGGSLALMALKNLVFSLLWHVLLRPMMDRSWDDSFFMLQQGSSLLRTSLTFLLIAVLALGILLIPMSLRKLEERQRAAAEAP